MTTPQTDSILRPGTIVGEYRITHCLGEGGMGVVYTATHPEIGKRVATKLLAPHAAQHPDLIRRFKGSPNHYWTPTVTSTSSASVSELRSRDGGRTSCLMVWAACALVVLVLAGPEARAADPTTAECLAASEASLSLRRHHKLRQAHEQLLVCAAPSCPADVRDECLRRVGDLKAAMPTVVFIAKDGAGNDLTAVQVAMDGQTIAERLEGTAVAVDPGEHTFTFALAGRSTVEKKLVIHEGEKARRVQVVFAATAGPVAPADAPARPPVLVSTPGERSPDEGSGGLGTQRILAIVAAGVGVVGVGVGVGFGLDSLSKHNQAQKACPNTACPDQNGLNLWNQASRAGDVSTAAFIVGGVALAGGAVLWLTAPGDHASGEEGTTRVGVGPRTLLFSGVW